MTTYPLPHQRITLTDIATERRGAPLPLLQVLSQQGTILDERKEHFNMGSSPINQPPQGAIPQPQSRAMGPKQHDEHVKTDPWISTAAHTIAGGLLGTGIGAGLRVLGAPNLTERVKNVNLASGNVKVPTYTFRSKPNDSLTIYTPAVLNDNNGGLLMWQYDELSKGREAKSMMGFNQDGKLLSAKFSNEHGYSLHTLGDDGAAEEIKYVDNAGNTLTFSHINVDGNMNISLHKADGTTLEMSGSHVDQATKPTKKATSSGFSPKSLYAAARSDDAKRISFLKFAFHPDDLKGTDLDKLPGLVMNGAEMSDQLKIGIEKTFKSDIDKYIHRIIPVEGSITKETMKSVSDIPVPDKMTVDGLKAMAKDSRNKFVMAGALTIAPIGALLGASIGLFTNFRKQKSFNPVESYQS